MIKEEDYFGLAKKIAKKYYHKGDKEDIKQIAYEALVRACRNFDESKGYKFSTYAYAYIDGEIKRSFRDGYFRRVKCPRDICESQGKIEYYMSHNGYDIVQDAEIVSKEFNIPIGQLRAMFNTSVHIDNSLENVQLLDHVEDEYGMIECEMLLDCLSERERKVIKMRYFEGKNQGEISKELNVAQSIISRNEKKALEKLRKELGVRI